MFFLTVLNDMNHLTLDNEFEPLFRVEADDPRMHIFEHESMVNKLILQPINHDLAN
jgi:hypothetical protein